MPVEHLGHASHPGQSPQAVGPEHRYAGAAQDPPAGHGEVLEVGPVVRVLVRDHHRVDFFDGHVALQVGQRAAPGVHPQVGAVARQEVAAARPTRPRVGAVAAKDGDGQAHPRGSPRGHLVDLGTEQRAAEPAEGVGVAGRDPGVGAGRGGISTEVGPRQGGSQLECRLVRGADQDDLTTDHIADGASQERVVGAAEQEGVHLGFPDGRQQPFGQDVHLVGVGLASFDELHETGQAAQVRSTAAL